MCMCVNILWQCSENLIGLDFNSKIGAKMTMFTQNKIPTWTTLASCCIEFIQQQ